MDISSNGNQVNVLFENEEEVDFLITMCYTLINSYYATNEKDKENAQAILDGIST